VKKAPKMYVNRNCAKFSVYNSPNCELVLTRIKPTASLHYKDKIDSIEKDPSFGKIAKMWLKCGENNRTDKN